MWSVLDILRLWHSGNDAWSRDPVTFQCCTVDRRHVHHSIMANVTWQRFGQSAKLLAVGHTTNDVCIRISWNANSYVSSDVYFNFSEIFICMWSVLDTVAFFKSSVAITTECSRHQASRNDSVRRVCCWGPGEQEISIDCCTAGATAALGRSSKCG